MEMDVNNNILEQFSSLIRIQGVDAGNGMHLPEINLENYFIVDTKLPEITSFIGDLPILSDNDLSNGYQCVIQLDEDCNVNLSPTFVFSGIDYLNPTITENQSNWISAQEYQATFNVADFNENVSSVDVLIENIRDEHGNPLLNPNQSDICSIDTKNPLTTGIFISDSVINIDDLTMNPQIDLVVYFDETMDTSFIPEIKLYNDNAVHESIVMNTFETFWSDSSTLNTELWVLMDTNNLLNLDLICISARDINENVIIDSIFFSQFYSDLKNPEVDIALPISTIISDSLIGSNSYYVDISFDEDMDLGTIPLVVHESNNAVSGTIQYNLAESQFIDNYTYRAFFHIMDENIEVDTIDLKILFGKDFAGNTQFPFEENSIVAIDTKNPSITNFTVNSNILTIGDQIEMTLSFDEAMDTNQVLYFDFNPVITSPVELIQTNYGWIDQLNLNIEYELINSDVNPYYFDLNIIDGTDKAGNLLIPYGVDTVFSIPGSLGIENAMESIQLYPNIISSGDQLGFRGSLSTSIKENFEIFNSEGKMIKHSKFRAAEEYYSTPALHIEPGIYYLKFMNRTYKFVVI